MFDKVSMAGTGGAIVVLLKVLLPLFGLDIPEDTIVSFIEAVLTVIGTVLLVIGQLRRPDLVGGIVRR